MKKLLSILGSTVIIFSGITPVVMNPKSNVFQANDQLEKTTFFSITSWKNIVKAINTKYNSPEIINESKIVDSFIENNVSNYYKDFLDGKAGIIRSKEVKSKSDRVTKKTFEVEFENNSKYVQTYNTQDYLDEVDNSYSFRINFPDIISPTSETSFESTIEASFLTELGKIEFNVPPSVDKVEEWNHTAIIKDAIDLPSQSIKCSPFHTLHVLYDLGEVTKSYESVVNFKIENLNEEAFSIPRFYFDSNGNFKNMTWIPFSFLDLVKTLIDLGYSDQLNNDGFSEYSFLSTDDIKNPKEIYVNLPISWKESINDIKLINYEVPIES